MSLIGGAIQGVSNLGSSIFNFAASNKAGKTQEEIARLNFIASQNQARTGAQIATINAENTKTLIVYVTVGILAMITIYFIIKWAFK